MSGHVIKRKRNRNQGGDPVESERLRAPFLAWVGKRGNRETLAEVGIPYWHGSAWIAGTAILAARHQVTVREILDRAGVEASPCS